MRELNLEDYRDIVKKMTIIEKRIDTEIEELVCKKLNIDVDVYRSSQRKLFSEEENKVKIIQYINEEILKKRRVMTHAKQLTRKFTWDMFQYQQKLRVSGIKALERIKRD